MIAEEETNKETITVRTTDQDLTMFLNKETIDRTTDQIIDLITDQDPIMAQDRTMVQDLITDQGLTMDLATDQLIQAPIN